MDRIASSRDFNESYPVNLEFHDYLVRSTGNKTLLGEYHSLVNKLHLCRARSLVHAGGLAVSNREHREMVDSLASGDRFRAQEAFFRHVEHAKLRFKSTLS